MSNDEVKPPLRSFVAQCLPDRAITDDDDLFAAGVNSLFAIQLVTFLEGKFGIEVLSEDLDLESFRTITALAAFVKRKRGAAERSSTR